MMITAQTVGTSVTVNENSASQDYVKPDDHIQPFYEMTPGFKPFTLLVLLRESDRSLFSLHRYPSTIIHHFFIIIKTMLNQIFLHDVETH